MVASLALHGSSRWFKTLLTNLRYVNTQVAQNIVDCVAELRHQVCHLASPDVPKSFCGSGPTFTDTASGREQVFRVVSWHSKQCDCDSYTVCFKAAFNFGDSQPWCL